jgi:hypothetical protein
MPEASLPILSLRAKPGAQIHTEQPLEVIPNLCRGDVGHSEKRENA